MAEQDERLAQLTAEKNDLENTHPMAAKFLQDEIDRIQSGGQDNFTFIELHQPKTKVEYRVKIPIKEFPQVNFVGKILGQGGENVKRLQEMAGCRIAVLGRGSMKDKNKQEELRQQGGKYAHLNYDLHVWIEAVGHPLDCYQRIVQAFQLIHPFLLPDPNDMQQQNGGMMRGGPRGGMRGRGGGRGMPRGGPMMGRGGGSPMMGGGSSFSGGRPPMRGGAGSRGARGQMGGRGAARGAGRGGGPAPRGRGASASASMGMSAAQSYGAESYNYGGDMSGYGGGYGETGVTGYEDPNAVSGYGTGSGEASDAYQYESYGQAGTGAGAAYGSYDAGWGSQTADASGYGKAQAPSRGGLANYRTRPY